MTAIAQDFKTVERNGMKVQWQHDQRFLELTMSAPSKGWVAIGFNESDELKDTYLIMGAVRNGKVKVKEYYVFAPGDYRSFEDLKFSSHLSGISGDEGQSGTNICFKLSADMMTKYTKLLSEGATFYITMAF